MATHDYIISNASGAAVRADLNNALAAIATNNSSATEPTTTYAYQWWADTGSSPTVMKLRNAANSGWITLFQLDGEWTVVPFENGTAAAPSIYFKDSGTDTGIYSPGTDQVGISAGGTSRFEVSTSATTSTLPVVHPLGAVGTPSITFTGDLNTGIWSPAADTVAVSTNGTRAITIDSSQRLGIGTTTPAPGGQGLHVHNASAADSSVRVTNSTTGATDGDGFAIQVASDGTAKLRQFESSSITFETAATERARIDSSGRLLVGTSSSGSNSTIVLQGSSVSSANESILRMANGSATPASGVDLGAIIFSDNTHTNTAIIEAARDGGTWSGSSKPTRLLFSTTADGASSPTEHMRITETGVFKCSTDGTYAAPTGTANEIRQHRSDDGLQIYATSGGFVNNVFLARASRNTTNNTFYGISYYNDGAGAYRFRVADSGNCTNTNNSYTGISDIKLKENVVDANSQWQDIKSLQVRNYNFKEETGQPTHRQIGLIAQEVETVCPHLVDESPDRDGDGNDLGTTTKSVQYSVLYMKAVKALQEAMERIEQLEAKVAALESA